MTTITFDISNDDAVHSAIGILQRIVGAAGNALSPGKTKPAATAPAGATGSQTAGQSAQHAAAPAASNAGNAAGAAGQNAAATTASSSTPAVSHSGPALTFDDVKGPFLKLSTKPNGRALCEGVLKGEGYKLTKLSEAKPEQYRAILDAIEAAAK